MSHLNKKVDPTFTLSRTQCSGLVHAQPPPSLLHLLDGGLLVVAILCDVAICARSLASPPPNRWIFLNGASSFFRNRQGCWMGKFRGHYVNMEKREEKEKWQTFSHSPRPRMWSSGRRRKVALDRVTDVSEHLGSGNSSGRRRAQSVRRSDDPRRDPACNPQ